MLQHKLSWLVLWHDISPWPEATACSLIAGWSVNPPHMAATAVASVALSLHSSSFVEEADGKNSACSVS